MPVDMTKIAITGAGGFVASNLRALVRGNSRVLCISRRHVRTYGHEEAVLADYSDPDSLASSLTGCNALVHLAGSGTADRTDPPLHANAGVTSVVARAAATAGIKKIIFLSGLGVSAKNTSEYFKSKLAAENHVAGSGIDYTIFRPSFIVGRNDYLTKKINRQIRKGRIIIPDGNCIMQPIHISAAVRIIADAFANKKASRKTFDMVGPEAVRFDRYVRAASRRCPIRRVGLAECLRGALNDPQYPYSLEDLYILFGGYVGDFDRLYRTFKAVLVRGRGSQTAAR